MRASLCAIVVLAAVAPSCRNQAACKDGTVFLNLTYDSVAAAADKVEVDVSVGGGAPVTTLLTHSNGATSGSVEVDFPKGYPQGQTITVTIRARAGSNVIGMGTAMTTLTASCQALAIGVNKVNSDFAIAIAPAPVRVVQGMSQATTVTLTRMGSFGDAVSVTVTGLPANVTVDPLTIAAGSDTGTLTFRSTAAATLGDAAMVTVTGTAGSLTHGVTVQLYVQGAHGSLDTTFGTAGKVIVPLGTATVNDGAHGVAINPMTGQIVVVGGGTNGSNNFAGAIALTSAGVLDTGFASGGKYIGEGVFTPVGAGTSDHFFGVALQPDGKIVAGGYAAVYNQAHYFLVARFTTGGVLDNMFGTGNSGFTKSAFGEAKAYSLALKPDGTIVLGGYYMNSAFAHYSAAGVLIGNQVDGPASSGVIQGLAARADGKVVAVAPFGAAITVQRYTAGEGFDASFGAGNGYTTAVLNNMGGDYPGAVLSLPDNTLYVAAMTKNSAGNYDAAVAHLSEAGALDTSFNTVGYVTTPTNQAAVYDKPLAIALEGDGKIILAYTLSNGATAQDFAWVRVGTDGKIDTTLGVITTDFGTAADIVGGVAVQPDGRIVVVGTVNANSRNNFGVARYWP
jgi:uncharacterized delta-60 repeat protein